LYEGLINDVSCPCEGGQWRWSTHGDKSRVLRVRSPLCGLIGFADFVGVAQTFISSPYGDVRAVIGRGECLLYEGLIDGELCPREGEGKRSGVIGQVLARYNRFTGSNQ